MPNGKTNPIPQLTDVQIALLLGGLLGVDANGENVIRIMPDHSVEEDYNEPELLDRFALIEQLQPDESEQEDAYKCCWDVVMSLYGEESVKLEMEDEGSMTRSWVVRSGVVRLLLHYDFLYVGIGEIN